MGFYYISMKFRSWGRRFLTNADHNISKQDMRAKSWWLSEYHKSLKNALFFFSWTNMSSLLVLKYTQVKTARWNAKNKGWIKLDVPGAVILSLVLFCLSRMYLQILDFTWLTEQLILWQTGTWLDRAVWFSVRIWVDVRLAPIMHLLVSTFIWYLCTEGGGNK